MTKSKETTVFLNTPQDWHVWYEYLQRTATSLDVWQLVDPEKGSDLAKPKLPTVDDYLDELQTEANKDRDQATPALPRPQDLTDGQRRILTERREDWKLKDRIYGHQ